MSRVQVSDAVRVQNGFAFESELFSNRRVGLPVARIRDVVRGYSGTYYTGSYAKEYEISNGDLLIGMDGEFNVGLWQGGRALLNQRVCKIVPKEGIADKYYLKHRLALLVKEMEAATPYVTVKHLSSEELKAEEIQLPELPEQKRIAALLEKADRLRRTRRYARQLSDTFLQSVFLEMFGGSFQRDESKTRFGDLVKITGGGTPSRDIAAYFTGTIPWLTSKDMRGDYIFDTQEHITEGAVANSATHVVPAGSILVVVKSKVLMHRLPVAISVVPLCHGQDIKSIQCSNELLPEFARYVLRYYEPHLLNLARGANTEGLTLPMLNELLVPEISLTLQQQFAGIVRRFERLRAQQREAERQAEHLFQTLLHRAFAPAP